MRFSSSSLSSSSRSSSVVIVTTVLTLATTAWTVFVVQTTISSIVKQRKQVADDDDLEVITKDDIEFNGRVLEEATDLLSEPWGLANSHLATLSAQIRPSPYYWGNWKRKVQRLRERISTPSGGALDVEFVDPIDIRRQKSTCQSTTTPLDIPMVLLLHGINGSSTEPYIEQAALQISVTKGWRVVILNYGKIRVLENNNNTSSAACCAFGGSNFMDGGDLNFLISYLRKKHASGFLAAVGFSMGGGKLLQYLGRTMEHCNLDAACCVSSPLDFTINNGTVWNVKSVLHRLYHFGITCALKLWILRNYKELKRHPNLSTAKPLRKSLSSLLWWINASTIMDFDDAITIRAKGYSSINQYYNEASGIEHLRYGVRIPFLCLTAKNDPIVPANIIPGKDVANDNENVFIVNTTKLGGHIGFWLPGKGCWATRALISFFESVKNNTPANPSRRSKLYRRKSSLAAAHSLARTSSTHLTDYTQFLDFSDHHRHDDSLLNCTDDDDDGDDTSDTESSSYSSDDNNDIITFSEKLHDDDNRDAVRQHFSSFNEQPISGFSSSSSQMLINRDSKLLCKEAAPSSPTKSCISENRQPCNTRRSILPYYRS